MPAVWRNSSQQDHIEAQLPLCAKMSGPDIVKKLRAQLDKTVQRRADQLIGDVPWSRGRR